MPRHRNPDTFSDSSCNSSTSTIDVIRDICNDCDNKRRDITCVSSFTRDHRRRPTVKDDYCPSKRFDPGVSYFASVITPLTGLSGFSGIGGSVEFRMRRKNKTVTIQWEPFTGTLASSGIAYLTVAQNICNTPPYIVSFPIYLIYKGVGRNTRIEIDPFVKTGNIKFYLNTDGSSSGTVSGDSISVAGGAVSWIVD